MSEHKSIETFFRDLSMGLLYMENTYEIDRVVDFFLEQVCNFYGFDCGEVYFPKGDYLILRGVYGIDRYYVCKVDFPIVKNRIEEVLYEQKRYVGNNMNISEFEVFNDYSSLMVLPIYLHNNPIGLITFRNKEDKREYYKTILEDLLNIMGHFAVYANNVLQNVTYKEKDKQLKLLRELYIKLSDINKFDSNLKGISEDIANIFSSRKAFMMFSYDNSSRFETISKYGFDDNFDCTIFEKENHISNCIKDGKCFINNIAKTECGERFVGIINRSVLFNRVMIREGFDVYIVVIDRIPDAVNPLGDFDNEDAGLLKPLLLNISSRVSEYFNIVELSKANEKNMRHMARLNTLYDMSNILVERSKTEDILFLLLTITTIGDVFAFNRAFAFLYDEGFNVFRGRMCIAPKDGEEAAYIWNDMKNIDKYALREKIMLSFNMNNIKASWDLNQQFINTVIPNNENCELFFEVFNTHDTINITNIDEDYRVEQLRQYTDLFGNYPFAIIPIMNATRCIGMILVDNPFNNKPIPNDDLDYLKMFGRQAAVALGYSSLYNELEKNNNALKTAQKTLLDMKSLAIIGEMSSSMAHNLRNFIVPIAGFANRLVRVSTDENIKKYAQIIADEVENLENYIRKNLSFAKSINLETEKIKIEDIIKYITIISKEYIKKSNKDIKFYAHNFSNKNVVYWDYDRMNEVIFNLVVNAIDAIANEQYAIISVLFSNNLYNDSMVDIVVENTNSYITEEIMENIFKPFFTTKSHGVGIGLAISKRIVEAHGGSMNVKSINIPFETTAFTITVPDVLNN